MGLCYTVVNKGVDPMAGRKLTSLQKDALDQQDKENNWGRWEIVGYRNGVPLRRWQVQMMIAEREAEKMLKEGHLFQAKFQRG